MIDVIGEFLAARASLTASHRARLLAAGIPARQLDAGWHGVARARRCADGLYEPADDGLAAVVSIVRGMPDGSIESDLGALLLHVGDVIDLMAWHPAAPGHWALRIGAARTLGFVQPQLLDPPPVHLWRTPLSWFRDDGGGIALLTREPAEQRQILQAVRHIVAEDIEHGRELRDLLSRPWPTPKISLLPDCERRAA